MSVSMNNQEYCMISVFHKYFASEMYILCLPIGTGRVVSVLVFNVSMNNQEYCMISVFHKYFAS